MSKEIKYRIISEKKIKPGIVIYQAQYYMRYFLFFGSWTPLKGKFSGLWSTSKSKCKKQINRHKDKREYGVKIESNTDDILKSYCQGKINLSKDKTTKNLWKQTLKELNSIKY